MKEVEEFKNGAISVRVSTNMQVKYSPDSQIKLCLEYAKKHNIFISEEHIYRDDGISGTSANKRNAFQRMIANAQKKPRPFDVILVYDFSRFARNKEESVMYKALLRKKCGIDVISITQPLTKNKESVLLESLYEGMDEYYVLNLSENVKRGKQEKATRGEYQGGSVFGYNYDKNTEMIYPDENTKDIVKFIFEEWIKPDTTINGLTTRLNSMGIKTKRGNKWCEGSLKYILNNPLYIGTTRFTPGGMSKDFNSPDIQKYKGKHDAIISIELWNKSQEKINEHNKTWFKYKKPAIKHDYWLRGLLKCSNCGKNLIMIKRKSGNKTKAFFQCNGYNKKTCEKSHSILQEKLENALLYELKEIFTKKLDINIVQSNNNTDNITILQNTINKCNSKLERIKAAYIDGIDTLEEYKEKKKDIIDNINKLNKQLNSLKTEKYQENKKNEVYKLCEYAHELLQDENVDFKIKEKVANELFDKIIYNKDENTLYVYFKEH